MKRYHLRYVGKNILNVLIVVMSLVALFFITRFITGLWSTSHKEWIGSFYTGTSDNQRLSESNEFDTREDCTSWGDSLVAGQHESNSYYTCGSGCKFKEDTISSGKRINTYECTELYKSTDQ